MAPEILKGQKYGIKADIWSIGVVFYDMLYGAYPYSGFKPDDILKSIKNKEINFSEFPISNQAKDFILKCLTVDVSKRINWDEMDNHQVFIQLQSIVSI